jgi:hypothetical protein
MEPKNSSSPICSVFRIQPSAPTTKRYMPRTVKTTDR